MLASAIVTAVTAWALIEFWPMTGLPFWPLFTTGAAILTLWGVWVGGGAWRAPLAILAGYGAMRAGMTYATELTASHIAFLVWSHVAAYLIHRLKAWIPAVCFLLSGATYPLMGAFGFAIEYMGLAPIIAEVFALFALVSMGGGLYDRRPFIRPAYSLGHLASGNSGFLARYTTGHSAPA